MSCLKDPSQSRCLGFYHKLRKTHLWSFCRFFCLLQVFSLLLLSFTSDEKPPVPTDLLCAGIQQLSGTEGWEGEAQCSQILVFWFGNGEFRIYFYGGCIPLTVCKSLHCSKSEKLTESFQFILFVVGTGVDQALNKMLIYLPLSAAEGKTRGLTDQRTKPQRSLPLAIPSLTCV